MRCHVLAVVCLFLSAPIKTQFKKTVPGPQVTIEDLPSVLVSSQLSYYIDRSRDLSFDKVSEKPFSTQTNKLLSAINKYHQRAHYWVRFSLTNTDSLSVSAYLYPGYFSKIILYEINDTRITSRTSGAVIKKDIHIPYPELYTIRITIPARRTIQYMLRLSSTADDGIGFDNVYVYSKKSLYGTYYHDYYDDQFFRFLQILFLGFMFSQMLYVEFQWVIVKRREYPFYLAYLILVTVYYLCRYDAVIGIYWPFEYYPQLLLYLKSVLLALPYLFYLKFVRHFLDIKTIDEKIYDKIIGLEHFIWIYVVADTCLRLLLPDTALLNNFLMITIFGMFLYCLGLIIALMRYQNTLVNIILIGSIIAAVGEVIGILITLLQIDIGILHTNLDSLVTGQIGIVVETILFTTSLSVKTHLMEKEKIESQNKLIVQLQENEALRRNMEKIRNKIAQDLHDDIGSTLSSILLYSNSAKSKGSIINSEAIERFAKISNIASSMMDEMSDIVWAINPVQDSMDKILKRMHYYAAPLANSRDIRFKFISDDDIQYLHLSMEKRKNLFLIFKESVTNALKYSNGATICVRLYRSDGYLHMIIKDDGSGFSSVSEQGNGLKNMEMRAEETGGKLEITSSENNGTSIHAMVPL
ncbi:MAG TPA: 7TM diverse intracellular signaling domain-containing protein [Balneolales bacterium]|nr:7TM diverse intracellular signaling domain-containing protein [Balneolales bacterium]